MMALSFEQPVPAGVATALRATPGILDAVALAEVLRRRRGGSAPARAGPRPPGPRFRR